MKAKKNTIEQRNELLATIFRLRKIIEQLSYDLEAAEDDDKLETHLIKEHTKTLDELKKFEDDYIAGLPKVAISRCPFLEETFNISIDTFGLDGFWWNMEYPIRPYEKESNTFFAITGSVNITGEVPNIPFPVKPGPAVPWVSPRLLVEENIIAVLSYIKIGNYDAYVTVYFSKDKTIEIERINTWGTDNYLAEDTDGLAVSGTTYDNEEEYDFDIAPWIEKGKLKWISPNDTNLKLKTTIENCPYLNLEGYQYPVLIQNKIMKNCMIKLEYTEDEITPNFCQNCGKPVIKGAKFCANCGTKL